MDCSGALAHTVGSRKTPFYFPVRLVWPKPQPSSVFLHTHQVLIRSRRREVQAVVQQTSDALLVTTACV